VNALVKDAAANEMCGVLGYEEKPLVSTDYVNDTRSGIVDALSTMVVDGTHLKLYVWYDNEYGYRCVLCKTSFFTRPSVSTFDRVGGSLSTDR
jgi:glyceraldehyde 3-phosphate dehydrogenase